MSGGIASTYNVPSASVGTTYYRLLVADLSNGCGDPVSNTVNVTVVNPVELSIAVNNPIVCINGNALITSAILNGSGLYNYQWQSSVDGSTGWTHIALNGNAANYTAITSVTGTIYYRLLVTDLSNGCSDPVSNVVSVDVNEEPSVSISVDFENVCLGGVSQITSNIVNGSGVYNYQWQSSTTGVNGWSNINPNGTSSSYTTVASVPGTTYYRIMLTDLSNGCGDPVSNVVYITVNDQPSVAIAVNNDIVCVAGSAILSTEITNGSGVYNYQWQSSPNGSSAWTNILTNGTGASYTAVTNVPGTIYYRLVLTDLSNGCADPISNVVSVTVEDQPTVDIEADNAILCIVGNATLLSKVTNGSGLFNYLWQNRSYGRIRWAVYTLIGKS
jgi:hypothetical protein